MLIQSWKLQSLVYLTITMREDGLERSDGKNVCRTTKLISFSQGTGLNSHVITLVHV